MNTLTFDAHLNYNDIADIFVVLPSEEGASVFCEEFKIQIAQNAKPKAQCETEQKHTSSLRKAILKAPFTVRPVRQNLLDEPASNLLKRIGSKKKG